MSHDSVLVLFVIVAAAAIVLQAIAMFGIFRSVQDIRGEVQGLRADVKQRLDPLAQSMTDLLADAREPARAILSNFAEVSRVVRDRANYVDGFLEELVDKSRLQVIRIDQLASSLIDKVEVTSDRLQQSLLTPLREVSAVVKGIKAGFDFFFSRRQPTGVSETTQDEQLFI